MSSFIRQVTMFDPAEYVDTVVLIAGLGNIGSHTALALARMGLQKFILYDFDTVEEHNLASQAYAVADVGQPKTEAIKAHMLALNPSAEIALFNEAYTGQQAAQIVISAVDNLESRRAMAEALPPKTYVVDGRMGGGQIEVHTQRAGKWAATIPESADDDPCGARFISYTSYIMAGLIANTVKRLLKGQKVHSRVLMHADTLQIITT